MRDLLKKNNILFFVIEGFFWVAQCTFTGFLMSYLLSCGYSNSVAGNANALIFIMTFAAQPVAGFLTDTLISAKKLVVICLLIGAPLFCFLFSFPGNITLTFVIIALLSLFEYMLGPIIDSWIIKTHEVDPSVEFRFGRAGGSLLYSIAAVFCGGLIVSAGYGALIVIHLISIAVVLVCCIFVPEIKPARKTGGDINAQKSESFFAVVLKLLKIKPYAVFIVCCMLYNFAMRCSFTYMPFYILNAGGTEAHLGLSLFFAAFLEFVVLIFGGVIFQRFKPASIFVILLVLAFFRLFLLFVFVDNLNVLIGLQLLQSVTQGLQIAVFVRYIYDVTPLEYNSTAISFASAFAASFGSIMGILAGGVFIDKLGAGGYALVSSMVVAAAFAAFAFYHFVSSRPKTTPGAIFGAS